METMTSNNNLPLQNGGSQIQMNNLLEPSNTPVAAFLRGNAPAPGMMDQFGTNSGMIPNNTASLVNNQAQMYPMNNLNLSDLKRLQQLQQQLQANQNQNNLASSQANPSVAILQNFLDQKIQSSRLGDSFGNSLGGIPGMGGQNSLIGSNLFQEHMMMNQNAIDGGMKAAAGNDMPLPSPHSIFHRDGSRRMRGGVIEPFPEKLHRLLLEVEAAGRSDIISFVANGRAFDIHMPDKFFKDIVPLYFRQSRLSSFKRQLNLYGFELITTGPARGSYFHELFVKDRPDLCRKMRRVAVKVGAKNASANKQTSKKESNYTATENEAKTSADTMLKQFEKVVPEGGTVESNGDEQ